MKKNFTYVLSGSKEDFKDKNILKGHFKQKKKHKGNAVPLTPG